MIITEANMDRLPVQGCRVQVEGTACAKAQRQEQHGVFEEQLGASVTGATGTGWRRHNLVSGGQQGQARVLEGFEFYSKSYRKPFT